MLGNFFSDNQQIQVEYSWYCWADIHICLLLTFGFLDMQELHSLWLFSSILLGEEDWRRAKLTDKQTNSFKFFSQHRPSGPNEANVSADNYRCSGLGALPQGQRKLPMLLHRAEVHSSFITTTVREESQVTPQGRHR